MVSWLFRGAAAGHGDAEFRRLSLDEVQALSRDAAVHQRSARGRLKWLEQNRDDVRLAVLRIHGQESEGVKRCIITLVMESGVPRWFTIDVSDRSLTEFPVLDRCELLDLVSRLLEHAEHVPIDE